MCSTGSTETGPTGDFGGHDLDGSRMPDVVENARSPLLEVTGAFASRVVFLDLRIKKVFVKHIVKASVDVDGLVNNGGIVGCGCSEGGRGDGGGLSKGSDGEGKGSEDVLQRHKPRPPPPPLPSSHL